MAQQVSFPELFCALKLRYLLSRLRFGTGIELDANDLRILYQLHAMDFPLRFAAFDRALHINRKLAYEAIAYLLVHQLINKDDQRRYSITIQGRAVLRKVNDALSKLAANPGSLAA